MAKISKFPQRKAAAALDTTSDLPELAVNALTTSLNGLLADSFALYMKTRRSGWLTAAVTDYFSRINDSLLPRSR